MQLTPDISLSINLPGFVLLFLGYCVFWLLITKNFFQKQQAERWVIHLEYIGTLIIGLSVAGTGITVGDFPLQAQLFHPWPGLVLILIAYQLKLGIQNNHLNGSTPTLGKRFVDTYHSILNRLKAIRKRKT